MRGLPEPELERFVQAVASDWRQAELKAVDRALCTYAEKLTRTPQEMTTDDLEGLRREGLTEQAIAAAIQVIAYFNYINRIADASGVDLEADMPPQEAHSG